MNASRRPGAAAVAAHRFVPLIRSRRSPSMARWLDLKSLFYLCLGVNLVMIAALLGAGGESAGRSLGVSLSRGLEAGALLSSVLTILVAVLLFRRRAAAAANMESRFSGLLDATPDPIVIMNDDGVIRLVNARAEQLFQESRERLVGRSVNSLLFQSGQAPDLENSLADYRDSQRDSDAAEHDLKARRKDGSWVPVELSF